MPLSDHERRRRGFFVAKKSGLFQMGVNLHGARVEFVILWNSHQAVRADDIVIDLKQGWCLIDGLINGKSERGMLPHAVCSISNHILSECWGWVHLNMYWN